MAERLLIDGETSDEFGELRDAGFEVRLVDANFHTILDDQGSLHCMTNEIRRTAT